MKVAEVRRVLVASPAYLAARGEPKAAAQLKEHDLIAVENFTQNGEWRFAGPSRPAVRVAPRLFTNSVEAAIEAAINGLGITRVLSYQVARHVRERRLAYVLGALAPPPVPVNLVFLANRQHAPNVRALLSTARRHFAAQSFL
jgi:DNA-binding transcriptional LysR family regulator